MKKLDRGLASYFISGIDTKQNLQTVPAVKYSKIQTTNINCSILPCYKILMPNK